MTQYLISADTKDFSGIVRNNEAAAFIVEQLREETTPEKVVDAMCLIYDAPREVIEADVRELLETLRGINAVEE